MALGGAARICTEFGASSSLPSLVLFRHVQGRFEASPMDRFEARRSLGCGLTPECFLLFLKGKIPELKDQAWPMGRRIPPEEEEAARQKYTDKFSLVPAPLWRGSVGIASVSIAPCLKEILESVIFTTVEHPEAVGVVYILHYNKLTARVPFMTEQLKTARLTGIFVTRDPDIVPDEERQCLGPGRIMVQDDSSPRPVSVKEDSLSIKHLAVAYRILQKREEVAMILEDDVFVSPSLWEDWSALKWELNVIPWSIVSVGSCYNHRLPRGEQLTEHIWFTQVMRCGHGYAINQAGASHIFNALPLQAPIDLQINSAAVGQLAFGGFPDNVKNVRWDPAQASTAAQILWVDPPLIFQWPPDVVRSLHEDLTLTASQS